MLKLTFSRALEIDTRLAIIWKAFIPEKQLNLDRTREHFTCSSSIAHFPDLSVQFSHSVMSNTLQPHELQHTRLPCLSSSPGVCPSSCPLIQSCHPTFSSSVTTFSFWPQSFQASGSFPMSQFFASGGQIIGASASASVLPMNIQDWFPLGLPGLISLQSKGTLKSSLQRQKYRSMEQNRKPRDKSTHLWTLYLQQRRQEYTMEKRQSL